MMCGDLVSFPFGVLYRSCTHCERVEVAFVELASVEVDQ